MKLMSVLMLAALPLYCYAGSGCQLLEDIISEVTSPAVSVEEFQKFIEEFVHDEATNVAFGEFKQCFLKQSNETLANVELVTNAIYSSIYCAAF